MPTSSGRKGSCKRCGHPLNEHARKSESKCKECKSHFEICQQTYLGISGYRLCYVPCTCGKINYPTRRRVVTPLEPYEYLPDHPGYRPREYSDEEEEESKLDMSLPSPTQAATSYRSQEAPCILEISLRSRKIHFSGLRRSTCKIRLPQA